MIIQLSNERPHLVIKKDKIKDIIQINQQVSWAGKDFDSDMK